MTPLPASVPNPGAVELGCWTLEDFRQLRTLRAALRDSLRERIPAGLDDVVERMEVVATELATNGLRHGVPPTVIRLLSSSDFLVVDVSDRGAELEPDFQAERPVGQGGLGLLLTRTFASEAGWYRSDGATHVWASFAL